MQSKVWLVFDLSNLTQHELIEVWATEEAAKARVVELNSVNRDSHDWDYDSRDIRS